jgi:hypothetical protein
MLNAKGSKDKIHVGGFVCMNGGLDGIRMGTGEKQILIFSKNLMG